MNSNEDDNEMLEWDKTNISRFAQYLYDLAKTKAKEEALQAEEVKEQEITIEEPVVELEPEPEPVVELEPEPEPVVELEPEVVVELEPEPEPVVELEPEPVVELEPEPEPEVVVAEEVVEDPQVDKVHDQLQRSKELEEVTIGLAKVVSGEDVEEIETDTSLEEIKEIIEQEKIPLPSEEKQSALESLLAQPQVSQTEISEPVSIDEPGPEVQKVEDSFELSEVIGYSESEVETIDPTTPIVTEPILDEEILIKPENIPEDVHKFVFVGEASSIPITEEEIPIVKVQEIQEEGVKAQELSLVKEIAKIEAEVATKKLLEPEPEPVVAEPEPEPVVAEPEPEPVVAEPEPEPVVAEPEPEPVVAELEPEPVVAEPEPEPVVAELEPEVVTELEPEVVTELEPELVVAELEPEPVVAEPEPEPVVAELEPEVVTELEPEVVTELEPELVAEPEPELDAELQTKMNRREEIIQQMLQETKKREEEDSLTVRGLGETEGRKYSAVVFGQESNKNLKKWKKIEKRRQKDEKKKKKK